MSVQLFKSAYLSAKTARHLTLRIPDKIAERVHTRLCK
jgi:hypothetical protein